MRIGAAGLSSDSFDRGRLVILRETALRHVQRFVGRVLDSQFAQVDFAAERP